MFQTYILQSELDGSYYIGHTSDISKRLKEHNQGKAEYTSKKIPWKLVYVEIYDEKGKAFSREIFLKKQRNRNFYQQLIISESNQLSEVVSAIK